MSRLVKRGAGPALNLKVGSGPPLTVNSSEKVNNLNADKLDGKDSTEIGVNGVETVFASSEVNSESQKSAVASCPSDKVAVGIGYDLEGAKIGFGTDKLTNVVADRVIRVVGGGSVLVEAYEEEPTSENWSVTAQAICVKADTP